MHGRARRAAIVSAAIGIGVTTQIIQAAPQISAPFASRFQITNASPIGDLPISPQIAFGPGGRLYVTRYNGISDSYAYNPTTGQLFDKRPTGVSGGFGIGFARHATPGQPARDYMYVCRNENFEGSIARLSDDNGNFVWGESGEVNVDIVRGVPYGDHTLDNIVVRGSQLFIGMGARTNNGRSGNQTGQNFHDTPEGPVPGGFGGGDPGFTYGETSYNGAIGTIRDLTLVPNTTSAAQLRDGPNGTSGNLLAGRDAFLPTSPHATLPYTSTASDRLVVHSAGTRNPYGLALDADGDLWFTNNYGRARTNGDGTSTPNPGDNLDDDFSDDVHDQFFRAVPGGDYRYDNTNFRGTAGFPTTVVVSRTFDNLDSSHPNFGALHDPANPDGLGPSSSSNGFDFGTMDLTGLLGTDAKEYALISRWTPLIMEAPPGTDTLDYRDVVVVNPDTGEVMRLAENFGNTIDVEDDGHGGFLVAEWGFNGTIYRITPRVAASRWSAGAGGAWSNAANWTGPVPNNVNAVANFTGAIAGPVTVNVDGPKVLGTLNFDNLNRYTLAGSTLSFSVDAGYAAVNVVRGNHTVQTPVHVLSNTTITIHRAADTLTLTGDQFMAPGVILTKAGPGTLETKHLRGDVVALRAGTTRILPNGTAAATSRVKILDILGGAAPQARLDLTNNALVIDHNGASPIATVAAQIRRAHNGGAWNQDGFTSSHANSNQFAVGYAEASSLSSIPPIFGAVDATSLLVRFTRYGDADLSGTVNLNDFNALASNFGQSNRLWSQGDFNYDGNVNLSDFNLLAANFGLSATGPGVTPEDWSARAIAVPEPGVVSALVFPAMALARRRTSRGNRSG